jgi:hypothetical protein
MKRSVFSAHFLKCLYAYGTIIMRCCHITVDCSMVASQDGVLITQQFANMSPKKSFRPKTSPHKKRKEVKNFIFHHLCVDNFLPVNLSNFFIGFNISNELSVFLHPEMNVCKKYLLIITLFANFESQSRTKRLKNTGKRLL